MVPYSPITPEIIRELQKKIDNSRIYSGQERLTACASDVSGFSHRPELVIAAGSVGDVQAVLQLANQFHFPVTPRGGGSGLAGGCVPIQGGVVLLTTDLNRILTIDRRNFLMKVEPGVISQELRDAADKAGLFYPPDPAGMDRSTIGGNAATDAGGPACVKYGTTRDYILGLEAVLPDGHLITTGVETRKGVVGYDLTNLLVGSEGTLGVITGLTLKLLAKPPATRTIMCVFSEMVSAMNYVSAVMGSGILPSAIEFLDHRCLGLVGELLPFGLPDGQPSLLIIEVDGAESLVDHELAEICALAKQLGAVAHMQAKSEEERQRIWWVRRQVSLRIHEYAAIYIPEDIVVPISHIAEMVEALPAYESRFGIEVFAFGHAGDGNIHLNITTRKLEQRKQAEAGTRELLDLTLQLRGTISGEHGIGVAKLPFISMELSATSLDLQRGIKRLFDPNQILNPGKLFPEQGVTP
jgi:glycolate oxidase